MFLILFDGFELQCDARKVEDAGLEYTFSQRKLINNKRLL